MNLGALSAFGGAIEGGFQAGEDRQLRRDEQQEALKQQRLKTQGMLKDQIELGLLGSVFSDVSALAPPDQPMPPQAAPQVPPAPQAAPTGPPPAPATSTGAPIVPPGGQFGVPGYGGGPAPTAAPVQAQPQAAPLVATSSGAPASPPGGVLTPNRPTAPPPTQPAPPPAAGPAATPQAQGGPARPQGTLRLPPLGSMSVEDMTKRIMSNPQAAAAIKKSPELLMGMLQKAQALLAPEAKAELAQMKVSMEYDARIQKIEADTQSKLMTAQTSLQRAEIAKDGAEQRATEANNRLLAIAAMNVAGRKDVAQTQVEGRKDVAQTQAEAGQKRVETQVEGRKDVAQLQQSGAMDRAKLRAETQTKLETAKVEAKKAVDAGKIPDEGTLRMIATARLTGDTLVLSGYRSGSPGRAAIDKKVREIGEEQGIKDIGPYIAQQDAEYKALTSGMVVSGKRGALLDQVGRAADKAADLVVQNSKAVPRGAFVLGNDGLIAAKKGFSNPAVAAYLGSLNALVNMYARAINPTGQARISDKEHAREILLKGYDQGAVEAAVKTIKQEIQFEQDATKEASSSLQKQIGGEGAAGAAQDDGWKVEKVQ